MPRFSWLRKSLTYAPALTLLLVAACGPTPTPTATPTPTPTTLSQPTTEATAAPTDTVTEPTATSEVTAEPTADTGTATPAPTADVGSLQWKQVGLDGERITDLAVAGGQTLDLALAAGPKGAWQSKFGYTDWQAQSVTPASEARTGEVEVASADVLYFSSHTGCASGLPNNSWRSTDGGATWTQMQMQSEVMSIAASNATTAYATSCSGVLKTTDAGTTWTTLSTPQLSSDPISLAASPDGQIVYAAFVSEGGTGQIWASADGGATWKEVTPTDLHGEESFHAPSDLSYVTGSVGRPDDGGLYLTTSQGIWHLLPDSDEWKFIKKAPIEGAAAGDVFSDWYSAFLVDTTYGTQVDKAGPVLYVARAKSGDDGSAVNLGVWRSTDMGVTWQQVGKGLETTMVNSLALALTDSTGTGQGMGAGIFETLLAGTEDGVWAVQR